MTRLFAALFSLAALSACAAGGGTGPAGERTAILKPGESIALSDRSQLHYLGVSNDSRCPPNVQCIRAGDADVNFELKPAQGEALPLAFNTERTTRLSAGGWDFELQQLAPGEAPAATLRIAAAP
ncbi:hypothetical protein [Lysobacter silvisoli]|uniref:Lipoprotein n=1 Tax=Lysobacter silvisoli TaxID=2293254 RepID=A0A371K1T3_9GAMM|nr:hypothetical protein [Lysobacter silvisoli]RDZ27844.1 hypothetical protein DX914_01360 [Lysobacter silvisoli]